LVRVAVGEEREGKKKRKKEAREIGGFGPFMGDWCPPEINFSHMPNYRICPQQNRQAENVPRQSQSKSDMGLLKNSVRLGLEAVSIDEYNFHG
jgi:hypothetical protein